MSNYDVAQKILKKATQKKKENDIDGALSELKKAYELCSKDPRDSLGILIHLRYPKYLLLAGKNDEAWSCLSNLLAKGYPGQDQEFLLSDYSEIYRAMSQFHKNENNIILTMIYSDMSFLADIYHHYLHSVKSDLMAKDAQSLFPDEFNDTINPHRETYMNLSNEKFIREKLSKSLSKSKLNFEQDKYIKFFISLTKKQPETAVMGSALIAEFNQFANSLFV